MKKFKLSYILIALAFILGFSSIYALEVDSDDVEARTYVIGTHMFTRNTNDNYDGQLTIKMIMLAAKTIPGDSLDDMVIYYKNPKGKWIDGVSGEELEAPDAFEIDYTDTRSTVLTPELSISKSMTGEDYVDFIDGEYIYDLYVNDQDYEVIDGTELFEVTDDGYELIGQISVGALREVSVELGKIRTFVARVYALNSNNQKVYSDYSEELIIDHTKLQTPTINYGMAGYACGINDECDIPFDIFLDDVPEWVEKINLYSYSAGDYTLESTITRDQLNHLQVIIDEQYYNDSFEVILDNQTFNIGKSFSITFVSGEEQSSFSNIIEIKRPETA